MPEPQSQVNEGDVSPAAPLSWRDVYKAVGDSEQRVIDAIKAAVTPLVSGQADHEARIRTLEAYANSLPIADRVAAIARITAVEKQVNTFLDREKGVFTTLGAGKTFLLVMAAVLSPLISIIALIISAAGSK